MSDVEAVTRLVLRERQARDRGWWEWMDEYYRPDSTVGLSWFRGSGPDYVERCRELAASEVQITHHTCAPAVRVNGDRAFAEAPTSVHLRTVVSGVHVDLVCHARLVYRLMYDDEWAVLSLHAVHERDSLAPAVPGETAPSLPEAVEQHRSSHARLAQVLREWGHPVANDVLGDDRPAEVDAFYLGVLSWLGI